MKGLGASYQSMLICCSAGFTHGRTVSTGQLPGMRSQSRFGSSHILYNRPGILQLHARNARGES